MSNPTKMGEENSIKVLHIDDDNDFLKTSKKILELKGKFLVTTVFSAKEAVELIEEEEFDVIVSDYQMPEKSGLDFLKELRQKNDDIPFVLLTGKGREEVAISALNLGANYYVNKIGKPETVFRELSNAITQAVNKKRVERKYKTLSMACQQSDFSVAILGKTGIIEYVNPKLLEIYGSTADDVIGQHWGSWVSKHSQLRTHLEEIKDIVLEQKKVWSGIVSDKFKETTFWRKARIFPLLDEKGNALNFVYLSEDITEQKQLEEKLRESEEMYRLLTENITDTIFIQDMSLRVKYVSPSVEALSGYTPEEVLELKTEDFMTPESYQRGVGDFLNAIALGKEGRDFEIPLTQYEYIAKDGSTFWGELRTNMMRDSEGNLIGLQGTLRDITTRKKAEQKMTEMMEDLRDANEKLDVVGKLSRHDIRNKLSIITNNVYLLKKRLEGDSEVLAFLGSIDSVVDQIERILSFTRAYEMVGASELFYVNVKKAFHEAKSMFSEIEDIDFVNECDKLTVLADSLLVQLLYNLIDNSLSHGETVTQIRICYKQEENELKLIYEDNGVGVANAEKEKIFLQGYGKGTGYGLYLIRKICTTYGWKIVEIGKYGEGAHFQITLPKIMSNNITYKCK